MLSLLLAASLTAASCDKGAPEPVGFHSRGFGYVAEIFPPKSRQNPGARPVAHLYEVGYPGADWSVKARRLWTTELAARLMPQAALVSMAGHLVTLDEYYETGSTNALVIYGRDGRFVRSFTLGQLLGAGPLERIQWSDCGRAWRQGVRFFFTSTSNPKLFVLLPSRSVLELDLETGDLRRGGISDFPGLRAIIAQQFPNEETEVWITSLRFSSISDLLSKN
jgi:hypothetical protein